MCLKHCHVGRDQPNPIIDATNFEPGERKRPSSDSVKYYVPYLKLRTCEIFWIFVQRKLQEIWDNAAIGLAKL